MTLINIAVLCAAGFIGSLYILIATSFLMLVAIEDGFSNTIETPTWFLVMCYCVFAPIIIPLTWITVRRESNE
jgi:hypothetical protein